ncbi:hypothetical protein GJ496_005111 [Pomphorhynchus laevis]|nr:hypothetical protein GJ496_005111 [Pomphorhynchus laevis]
MRITISLFKIMIRYVIGKLLINNKLWVSSRFCSKLDKCSNASPTSLHLRFNKSPLKLQQQHSLMDEQLKNWCPNDCLCKQLSCLLSMHLDRNSETALNSSSNPNIAYSHLDPYLNY